MKNPEKTKLITISILLIIFAWIPYFGDLVLLSEAILMTTFVISLAVIGLKCDNKEVIYTFMAILVLVYIWLPYLSNKSSLGKTIYRTIGLLIVPFVAWYITQIFLLKKNK